MASALGSVERIEEARSALDKLLELNPDFSLAWFQTVNVGADPRFTKPYFDGLHKAGLDKSDRLDPAK